MRYLTLECPRCGEKLPYVNAKMNSDRSVRVWRRLCRTCGLVVVDTGVFSREVEEDEPTAWSEISSPSTCVRRPARVDLK